MKRSEFLKLSALSLIAPGCLNACLSGGVLAQETASTIATAGKANNNCHYWNKGTRLTISMWDISWLSDQCPGGKFENIEQRVEEAAERGYNTFRIDCFPSRLLEKETLFSLRAYRPAMGFLPCWGNITTDFSCNALEKLKLLADACRKHGIWLGLDSWEKGNMFAQSTAWGLDNPPIPLAEEEKMFRGFAHMWVKAIRLMREEGILEQAVWVAPMNEVPHFCGGGLESMRRINADEETSRQEKDQRINERYQLTNLWLGEEIKEEISRDGIPLSYSSLSIEEYARRLPEIYDVVDVHFMPGVITNREEGEQYAGIAQGNPATFPGYEKMDLKRFSEFWDRACRNNYAAMLARTRHSMQTALNNVTFPSGKRMQAVITESFGPCFWPDHPDVSWDWYKHYNGDSARIAAAMPFEGISLSNYAEPLFTLWDDVDWHRNANLFIQNVFE